MNGKSAPVGAEQVAMARSILQKYKAGKAALEQRLIENEQWYKLRHWDYLSRRRPGQELTEPVSGWLFNAICAKHADAMDNFPVPLLLPRQAEDRPLAEKLSAVLPVILEQDDFEQTYSDVNDDKLRSGTGIYGVFWDTEEGEGNVAIRCVDPISLFWEPGVSDIQKSRNVFLVELVDRDLLRQRYPLCGVIRAVTATECRLLFLKISFGGLVLLHHVPAKEPKYSGNRQQHCTNRHHSEGDQCNTGDSGQRCQSKHQAVRGLLRCVHGS